MSVYEYAYEYSQQIHIGEVAVSIEKPGATAAGKITTVDVKNSKLRYSSAERKAE